jgi:hypothetical protein
VPAVYLAEWRKAENRDTCALLVPASLGDGEGATPRRANFSGGWAVAYDKPGESGTDPSGYACDSCGRGAMGVAGTGADAGGDTYTGWPLHRQWADGSHADYGPSQGVGAQASSAKPEYLAYLFVAGQKCLYNVWSYIGQSHLERMLDNLRHVQGAP